MYYKSMSISTSLVVAGPTLFILTEQFPLRNVTASFGVLSHCCAGDTLVPKYPPGIHGEGGASLADLRERPPRRLAETRVVEDRVLRVCADAVRRSDFRSALRHTEAHMGVAAGGAPVRDLRLSEGHDIGVEFGLHHLDAIARARAQRRTRANAVVRPKSLAAVGFISCVGRAELAVVVAIIPRRVVA